MLKSLGNITKTIIFIFAFPPTQVILLIILMIYVFESM